MTGQVLRLPGEITLAWCPLEGVSGHEAGRQLLRQLCGGELPEIAVTDRGKPYFPDGRFHFSISHTGRHAFCAAASRNIGIDAEEMDRPIRMELSGKILSQAELVRFREAEDPREALLRLWVLKEADAKRSGDGLRGYPNHTDFSPEDPRVLKIAGCYVAVLAEGD